MLCILNSMKTIPLIIVLALFVKLSFGQACGIYRVEYTGIIKSELNIIEIRLPSIAHLHGLKVDDSKDGLIAISPDGENVQIELISPLTSNLYSDPQKLISFYKSKVDGFQIVLIVHENGIMREVRKTISWSEISISKVEDVEFGTKFMLDFKQLRI